MATKQITFDFNNLMSASLGETHGVTQEELASSSTELRQAHAHLLALLQDPETRVRLSLEWTQLPFQDKAAIREVKAEAKAIAAQFENVLFLGIGGSYLGLKAAQDALCDPYYNEFTRLRGKRPRIYFEGNNVDPDTLAVLLASLNPRKTFVVVISKSGETTETKAAFAVVEQWLKKGVGTRYGRQVMAITDPYSGTLRTKVNAGLAKDLRSFRSLPLLKGVGGRYSEFNMGLLHLAVAGIEPQEVLDGAAAMYSRCLEPDIYKNPAMMYALLHTILYRQKGKDVAVFMPFSETLKSTGDWYCQLLAESLGKKYGRSIIVDADGKERWERDTQAVVNVGRTPVACRGTNDLHSIQQNNIEGGNNKAVTFIRVEAFRKELTVRGTGDFLSGKKFSQLINLAQEATEWALVKEQRPNCTVTLPSVSPFHWGGLLFFFEMATAYEGELLNVNAFDQPGVEGYKNYVYYKLHKPGLPEEVAEEIRRHPLSRDAKFIF